MDAAFLLPRGLPVRSPVLAHPPRASRSVCLARDGLTWEVEVRPGPRGLRDVELVSTLSNRSGRGLALPGWGPAHGLHLQLVTPDGQKLFDPAWGRCGAASVLPDRERSVARIGLGERPMIEVREWRTPPLAELLGLSDPRLEREDHLWLLPSQHLLGGDALRADPLPLPLAAWRRGALAPGSDDPWLVESMERLRCTELVLRPGRLLVGFPPDLALVEAKRAVSDLGYAVVGERLWEAVQMLSVAVPSGQEAVGVARLEATGPARVATREPIVCGLSG